MNQETIDAIILRLGAPTEEVYTKLSHRTGMQIKAIRNDIRTALSQVRSADYKKQGPAVKTLQHYISLRAQYGV